MNQKDFTTSFTVSQPPEQVFAAIINPRAWWSGEFDGDAKRQGDIFAYRYEDLHFSRQQVSELVPDKRVAWKVLDSNLSFLSDKSEWTGTTITFDIERMEGKTKLTFTHVGLQPAVECFDTCTNAWTALVQGSLKQVIETGTTNLIKMSAPAI